MALDGQSTAAIATKLGISDIAVRKRLGEVYKKFQIGGNCPGKLSELRHQLLFSYHTEQGARDFSPRGKGSLFKMALGTDSKIGGKHRMFRFFTDGLKN